MQQPPKSCEVCVGGGKDGGGKEGFDRGKAFALSLGSILNSR